MTNQELAKKLVSLLGDKDNILRIENCMTRLRVEVKDATLVNQEEIKKTEGVLGLVVDNNYFQVVLGPGKVRKVCDICKSELAIDTVTQETTVSEDWKANKEAIKSKQKSSKFKNALKLIADIFVPLIPAIIAAGLFNGFASLITQCAPDTYKEGFLGVVYNLFSLLGGGFLTYFAIYTGIRAAKVFGATPALGGIIGAVSIGAGINEISKILGLYDANNALNSILTTGKGGIIGVIFGVYLLAIVEKFIRKHVPDVLDLIITPFVSLLAVGTVFVLVIMPLTGFISDGLVWVLTQIIDSPYTAVRVISGYILAAIFLPMVLLGLHHGLIPIYAIQLEQFGGVSLFPVLAMAGAGQVGAAIAIFIKARKKNKRLEGVITGALPAGLLGVGEPLIYGVTLPMFKPFITAGLGAGFGGAYVMLTHVTAGAWGPSGLVAIPLMQSPMMMLNYFIGLVISYVAGFIITYFVIKEKDVLSV